MGSVIRAFLNERNFSSPSQKISDHCDACLPNIITISVHLDGLLMRLMIMHVTSTGSQAYLFRLVVCIDNGHLTQSTTF